MKPKNYSYSFLSSKSPEEVYNILLDVNYWWTGLYGEEIKGSSKKMNDEFLYSAGGGLHFSKQQVTELVPNRKITWTVTDSKLDFIDDKKEWTNTTIHFDIDKAGDKTKITFTHQGLMPGLECYDACSGAWTKYMQNLEQKLN